MANTVLETVAQSGVASIDIKKIKECGFKDRFDLEKYIDELLKNQDRLCALTGLPLVLDGEDCDTELRCSLDRIDSNRHYECGNLQIVCKFANRCKGASDNASFISLIEKIRTFGI
jgi:hypothetical protein